MTAERWQRVKEITADALECEPADRDRFVEGACGDDQEVLHEVRRLLAEAEISEEDFLSSPPFNLRQILKQALPQAPYFSDGQIVAGRFQVIRFLNRGGMGEVYAATDLELQETVALKTIRHDISSSPTMIERFKQEVKQTRSVTHPNVCRVYDLFCHEQSSAEPVWFLTMQLLEGQTLGERLASSGEIAFDQAVPLIRDMAAALSAAHDLGIVHRDFKPNNVMLVPTGRDGERAVVTDFGLALSVASRESVGRPAAADGTPAYMAPEQAAGGIVGFAADQYALGLVICEMLTNRRPELNRLEGEHSRRQLKIWLRSQPRQRIGPRAQRAIRRCLEFRPQDRFRDVRDIVPVLDGSRRRSIVRWAVASGTLAAALAGVVAVAVSDWGDRVTDAIRVTPETDLSGPPSISRDGKWISYMSDRAEPGNLDIWIQPARGGLGRRLTTDPAEDAEPCLSPGGEFVAFRSERNGGGIYLVGADGSGERLVVPGGRNPAVSPDGRSIAYWLGNRDDSAPSAQTYVISIGGGAPRRIASDFVDARYPVWNADGNFLLFEGCRAPTAPLSACAEWWTVRADGRGLSSTGALALLKAERIEVQSPPLKSWRGDRVLFDGARGDRVMLWELTLSRKDLRVAGRPRQLTPGDAKERNPTLAETGDIAFGRISASLHVWRIPVKPGKDAAREFRVTHDPEPYWCPSVSRDGRRLFFIRKTGDYRQLLMRDLASGRDSVLLASDADEFWPIPNGNGERVAFESRRKGQSSIGLIVGGSTPATLCTNCARPTGWFAGDRALLYSTAKGEIALLDVAGGRSTVVLAGKSGVALGGADWSPRHEYLAFTASKEGAPKQVFAVHFPQTATAPEGPWIPITRESEAADLPHWSSDGKSVLYLSRQDGHSCIWERRFDAAGRRVLGQPSPLMHYHDPRFTPDRAAPGGRGLSVAGDWVYINVGEVTDTVWTGVLRTSPVLSFLRRFLSFR